MQSIVICLPISSSFSYFCVSPLPPFLQPEFHSYTYTFSYSLARIIDLNDISSFLSTVYCAISLFVCVWLQPPPPHLPSTKHHAATSNLRAQDAFKKLPPLLCITWRVSSNPPPPYYWFFV
jgi:hypothetical protein